MRPASHLPRSSVIVSVQAAGCRAQVCVEKRGAVLRNHIPLTPRGEFAFGTGASTTTACSSVHGWLRNNLLTVPVTSVKLPSFDRLPARLWSVCDRLHIVALPTYAITRFVERRPSRLVLIFGPNERGLRALRRRSGREFDRLVNTVSVMLVEVGTLDQCRFDLDARELVLSKVISQLESQ
jgi:hypothetical protein